MTTLAAVLANSTSLTSNLNNTALQTRPAISNLTALTARLNEPGALGEWLFPTNLHRQLEDTLATTDAAIARADFNLTALAENLGRSLDNLANLTHGLNDQIQANTNILSELSRAIVEADTFLQGLKRHWLLRSAFRSKETNAPPPPRPAPPIRSPKGADER